eukprot:5311745-Pyramimonas_sp.AAC.1
MWSDFDASSRSRTSIPEREAAAVVVLKNDSTISVDPSIVSVVDAKSLSQVLVKETAGGNGRRVAPELCVCRHSMRAIGCRATWV